MRYTEISVEKLSAAADLTRTTFYAYFEDKVDLLLAWLDDVRDDVGAAPATWAAGPTAPTRAELRQRIDEALARYRPHASVLAALRDTALFEARADSAYRALVHQSVDGLRDHIEHGQTGGWIQPSLPALQVATWLASMVHRSLSASPPLDDAEYAEHLDGYTDIFWNTLYRPARVRPVDVTDAPPQRKSIQ
ncbi:TetR/AcrR family transcriptional regulator [Mycobacterium palustre]|uniref:TetR/AcrR family transcriptional regulator n=1 Tax=Mycobacterium palustre TaxID=153971 RepID=UPI0013027C93|nr:TetR/AcrR family transcriptional regulator [Mycobacterium palustre]MCV7102877.1 TetR/AcrR family transcriptional regulator [Mycobacterium palustre]